MMVTFYLNVLSITCSSIPVMIRELTMTILPFYISEEDIQQGMVEWPTHLQPLPAEDIATLEICTKHNLDQRKVEAT
jgi:hypothetical protein